MELVIKDFTTPSEIAFNYEELKNALSEKVKTYETMVYTDDQIKQGKADRAALNRLKTALNDERIKREREYMQPFADFKAKIDDLIAIVSKASSNIDKQIKEADEKRKADKRVEIGALWERMERPEWLVLTKIFDEKWLNATVTIKSIVAEIDAKLEKIKADMETIQALDEFSFEAMDEYKRTLDLGKAIAEGKRLADIQKRKEEQAEKKTLEFIDQWSKEHDKQPETVKPVETALFTEQKNDAQWIKFAALLTVKQATLLKEFFKVEGIEFKAI